MRQGRVFRRCGRCSRRVSSQARHCAGCGHDRATWAYVVDLAPPGAPREQQLKSGFATKRDALTALNDVQVAAALGDLVRPAKITVGEYLQEYLQEWLPSAKVRLRPGAYDACELHVRAYLVPFIGDVPLQSLTERGIASLYAELERRGRVRSARPLSPKTVHNVHNTLNRALSDAVRARLIPRNPAAGTHRQPEDTEQPTWSPSELRQFLDHVASDPLHALWRLAATTGLRRGELVGLRWHDVDLQRGRVSVQQQRAKGGGTVAAGPTKTRRARRLLSLDEATVDALVGHRESQARHKELLADAYTDHGYVFCLPNGRPLHPDRVSQMFRDHVTAAGLPWIKLHGLRHTHATLLLQAGVHPKVVQERLGHSSIVVTLDTYSHAIPAMQEEAATKAALIIDQAAELEL